MTRKSKLGAVTRRRKVYVVNDRTHGADLSRAIDAEKNLCVCGGSDDLARATAAIARLKPVAVVVLLDFADRGALTFVKKLRRENGRAKLLVACGGGGADYANRVLRAGADGYVAQLEDKDEIVEAILDLLAGHLYVSEDVLSGPASIRSQGTSKRKTLPLKRSDGVSR